MKTYNLELTAPEAASLYFAFIKLRTDCGPTTDSPKDIDLLAFHLGIEQKLEQLLEKIKEAK